MFRVLTYLGSLALLLPSLASAGDPSVYRIGVSKSMYRDVPAELVRMAGQPFQDLIKAQTGLTGEMLPATEAMETARAIDEGKIHLGVFPGHEFAWAKEKYPDLQPIICSVYRPKEIHAVILVRHDCKATTLADMKDSKLALAPTLKDHARLFWERKRAEDMDGVTLCTPKKAATVHDGINSLIDGEVDVTVADHADWNYFEKLYPGPAKNVKVLTRSEEFPQTVLVYKKGSLSEDALGKIRNGFITAHENPKAARMMKMIRIDRFSTIPDSYDESLRTCLKLYPKPLGEK
jgi:ABC-type phosphate/phosphonate transport system substrate-binding protein